jgi:hypothetical protein
MEPTTHNGAAVRRAGTRAADPAVLNPAKLAALEKMGYARAMPSTAEAAAMEKQGAPPDFVPLHLETRTHVTTAVMCRHLNRKEQTARGWASAETFPDGLRPVRCHGRLAWPVAGIRAVLGVAQ